MRNLALGAFALVGLAAVAALSPAEARWAPEGSYRATCRGINFDGDLLTASCQRRDGTWRNTYLDNADDCDSNIVNNDGQLECGWSGWRRPDYTGEGPDGSYRDSCTNIRMDGYTLRATCQRRDGSWKWTSLEDAYDCDGSVTNWNGNLVCRR
ncbi:MAG: CVNH domain-containing protein [Alphaproteobacteria bacterium]|nr:CVNH domain-containing protein [Alphaproteobacteria bacterium]MBL6937400.1 CVNH domain-containing protein [Alphaproteobacteria bacterium]MBL7096038.1 CVNH domain-containing protein [Alphaproteobacteria bacterium]